MLYAPRERELGTEYDFKWSWLKELHDDDCWRRRRRRRSERPKEKRSHRRGGHLLPPVHTNHVLGPAAGRSSSTFFASSLIPLALPKLRSWSRYGYAANSWHASQTQGKRRMLAGALRSVPAVRHTSLDDATYDYYQSIINSIINTCVVHESMIGQSPSAQHR